MAETLNPEFRQRVDRRLDELLEKGYRDAPVMRELASSKQVDRELFVRHTIETILRIRLGRVANSKCLAHLAMTDPFAAKKWAKYTEEEMLHDRLFLKDLVNLGLNEADVYGTDTFAATKLLQGYLYYTLEHEGPRGVLTKSYFLEYMSDRTQRAWNENVKRSLGDQAVKGSQAHVNFDDDHDHGTDVWNVLMSLVKSSTDEERVLYHLGVYYQVFLMYFTELSTTARTARG
ncbi:MAG TPA: iron-containing redox enzyme family protein [Polyangiaceae bacterium]|nr:iron-containing redox enzyme family protein [Polyangiaceae bacterium]